MASTTAPEKRKPETYTAEEMTALLSERARVVGSCSMYAAMRLHRGDLRMTEVAASYTAGRPVGLREHAVGLGTAAARHLAESIAVGAGMGGRVPDGRRWPPR